MIEVLLQRHIEAFFKAYREHGGDVDNISSPERAGQVVRAASDAGIVELKQDAGEMLPREIVELSAAVNTMIAEALEVDPLSFYKLQIALMEKALRLKYSNTSGITEVLEACHTLGDILTSLADCLQK